MDEKQIKADEALMDEFATETDTEEVIKTEATDEEGLNYYLNMMAPEWTAAPIEERMDFIKQLLNA